MFIECLEVYGSGYEIMDNNADLKPSGQRAHATREIQIFNAKISDCINIFEGEHTIALSLFGRFTIQMLKSLQRDLSNLK